MAKNDMEQTLKRIAWIVGLFGIAALIISAVEYKKGGTVSSVHISIDPLADGSFFIDESDIMLAVERSMGNQLKGQKLARVDIDRVERVLEEDPFVLNADVFVDAENSIHMNIEQRVPILRIIDEDDVSYYLDKEGSRMPLSKHFTARVIVATGQIPAFDPGFKKRKGDVIKGLFELTLEILEQPFYRALVESIHVDKSKKAVLIPKIGKQKIKIGRLENIPGKLERLKIFYEEGIAYEGWNKYKTIDVQFEGQVVCQK